MKINRSVLQFTLVCFFQLGLATRSWAVPLSEPQADYSHLLEIELNRNSDDPYLLSALDSPITSVAQKALEVIGRIGDPKLLPHAVRFLSSPRVRLRAQAATAIGLIGDSSAREAVKDQIGREEIPAVRAQLFIALGRIGTDDDWSFFETTYEQSGSAEWAWAHAVGLFKAFRSNQENLPKNIFRRLVLLAREDDPVASYAAFALSRHKGEILPSQLLHLVKAVQTAKSEVAKGYLIRLFGLLNEPVSLDILEEIAKDTTSPSLQVEAVRAAGRRKLNEATIDILLDALKDSNSQVVSQALSSLQAQAEQLRNHTETAEEVAEYIDTARSLWLKSTAIETLASVNPERATPFVLNFLRAGDEDLLPGLMRASGSLTTSESREALFMNLDNANPIVVNAALDGIGRLSGDYTSSEVQAMAGLISKGEPTAVTRLAELIVERNIIDLVGAVVLAYGMFTAPDQVEGKVAILNAIGALGSQSHVPAIEMGLADSVKQVVEAAASAWKKITGEDVSSRIPVNSHLDIELPALNDLYDATHKIVEVRTTRGLFRLEFFETAPYTTWSFLQLIKSGFYNGLTFHRVVPNFVAQGGDPTGTGYGGPGYILPEEWSELSHTRGIVGMATSGKDTGGSQFFINHSANLHLDGRYTAFAKVASGMDVVDQLQVGDRVEAMCILPERCWYK